MRKHLLASSVLAVVGLAQAHSGHGLPGTAHWHSGDALPLLALALAAAAGLWLNRKK